jgi:hypothetical protein
VKAQRGRICPLICGSGQHEQGGRCVAIPAPAKPQLKKEAVRPPEPSPREKARERARERAEQAREKSRERSRADRVRERRAPVASAAPRRSSCPAGSSPMSQGGRMCCEVTPEGRGAPHIFCP